MRTTLSIDDRVLRNAKVLAAREGTTLSAIVESALREKVTRLEQSIKDDTRPFLVFPMSGGIKPGVDINNNAKLLDLMDRQDAIDRRKRSD